MSFKNISEISEIFRDEKKNFICRNCLEKERELLMRGV